MMEDKFGKKKVYYGSMKSGKSSSLAREIERFDNYRRKNKKDFDILIFKPVIDDRVLGDEDSEASVSTRDGKKFEAIPIHESQEILQHVEDGKRQFIGVDEVMMLDSGIIDVVKKLDKDPNKYIVLTGLDKSYRGDPFPFSDHKKDMYDLINLFQPEERYKIYGWCDKCGRENIGEYTQRYKNLSESEERELSKYYDPLIVIGDEEYESRCAKCFEKPPGKHKWLFIATMLLNKDGEGIKRKFLEKGSSEYGDISKSEFQAILERMNQEMLVSIDGDSIKPTKRLKERIRSNL